MLQKMYINKTIIASNSELKRWIINYFWTIIFLFSLFLVTLLQNIVNNLQPFSESLSCYSRMGYGLMQEYYYLILATCWQCRPVKMFTGFTVYELQTNSIKAFHNKILRPSYLANGELEKWKKGMAFCYNGVLITCHDKEVQKNTAAFLAVYVQQKV